MTPRHPAGLDPAYGTVTVNSRKSRTLFINYNFRSLMVAEIY